MTEVATSLQVRANAARARRPMQPDRGMITIGKDVLELLSNAMYVDPLAIYREYVQNAADSIDAARAAGVLGPSDRGEVTIGIDPSERSIRIRDNGAGIPVAAAPATLLSIGASAKRGTGARGFRGVGRLAGLAYARKLIFRTRAADDEAVLEVVWDCQKLKSSLRDVTRTEDLSDVMQRVVALSEIDGADYPPNFFEVEMTNVVRVRRDVLLNEDLVASYLSQVAPVPFSADFSHADAINEHLRAHVRMADLHLMVGKRDRPIRRPHQDEFPISDSVTDRAGDLELIQIEGDAGPAAVGWVMHHGYLGSIPMRAMIGGLRVRAGNVQIGSAALLEEYFPEVRFNGWSVGELHVLDPRVLPNARRDDFEQNGAYADLTAEIVPIARSISRRCRAASIERNLVRKLERVQVGETSSPQDASGPAPHPEIGRGLEGSRKARSGPAMAPSPGSELVDGFLKLLERSNCDSKTAFAAFHDAFDTHYGQGSEAQA